MISKIRNGSNERTAHLNYSLLTEALTRRRFLVQAALAAAAPMALRAQGGSGTISPYLQSVTENSIFVTWRTDSGTESTVLWGTSAGDLDQTTSGSNEVLGTSYNFHTVQLTGLSPSTFYYYKVQTGSSVSAVHRFRTLPVQGTNTGVLRFLVIGDNQILNEPRYETIVGRAKATIEARYGVPIEQAIDVFLNVGDQVDVGTLQHYQYVHLAKVAAVSPNLAFMTLVGNHETYSDPGLARYKSHFNYTHLGYAGITSPGGDTYYCNHVANILFLHLNSEDTSTAQTSWVTQIVNAAKNDAGIDWIVSLCHRPYQAEQYVGDISSWFRNTIAPILAQTPKHVLNIGAHHHLYARGQMRDWPVYHIISGGTAWDQFWGQATETDFDDVQKTIANWCWQILEFDLSTRTLKVECFAEAHPKLGFVYPSTLVDTFHRQMGLPSPAKPALLNQPGQTVTLPFVLETGPFSTTSGELLNSTHFQVSTTSAFSNLKVDRIRDFENFYGDTGAPSYTPVNIHSGLDLLKYSLTALPNGTYYARARHRDRNTQWSPWSDALVFTVAGSAAGDPLITMNKRVYAFTENMEVTFENAPGVRTDWVGIYKTGQTPGNVNSTTWRYLNGTQSAPASPISSGVLNFTNDIAQNQQWFAVFLTADGYTEVAPRVDFYVGNTPVLSVGQAAYDLGQTVPITYSNAPGQPTDWIAIYKAGKRPGIDGASVQWNYVSGTSGTMNFVGLGKGFYFAVYLANDGYFEVSERVAFSVGDQIAALSILEGTTLPFGESFTASFQDGPGTPKDYVGIFTAGATPGVDRLVTYLYVGGQASGQVVFSEDLPAGDYYLALFINDSYTEVSNRANFTVVGGPQYPINEDWKDGPGGNRILAVKVKPGTTYRLEKSTDNMGTWNPAQTFVGEGLRMELTVPINPLEPDAFYRVVTP